MESWKFLAGSSPSQSCSKGGICVFGCHGGLCCS